MNYLAQCGPALDKRLDGATVSLSDGELRTLIDQEAKLAGLSGAQEAIESVRRGHVGKGLIWDDLSLLVSLLIER
jgi:hypothetical protein